MVFQTCPGTNPDTYDYIQKSICDLRDSIVETSPSEKIHEAMTLLDKLIQRLINEFGEQPSRRGPT